MSEGRLHALGFAVVAGTAWCAGTPPRVANTFQLAFPDGSGQIEWVSASTFRLQRTWAPLEPTKKPLTSETVVVWADDSGPKYSFKSRYLAVAVEKSGQSVSVRSASGVPVAESRLLLRNGRGVVEQRAGRSEHFYGLGAKPAAGFDLRGSLLETRDAFLLSSAGYGEYYPNPGTYQFDLGETRRVVLPGERIEYFCYYGPTPKGILEEHLGVAGPVDRFDSADFRIREPRAAATAAGSWETLGETVWRLLSEGLSARLIPEFDLAPYERADAALAARAAEIASVMPVLRAAEEGSRHGEMLRWRERLRPYLLSYTKEARDRGAPVMRPLEIDYGDDPVALNRSGEFMLGDELLVAPVLKPQDTLAVYLPRGIWTDLRSGEVHQGRREISLRAASGGLAVFVKNGSIVPLESETGDILELHYFPKLGAEFFLFEEQGEDISQFHAAPAGAFLRLEIESRVGRVYDWVVHHAAPCRKVSSGGAEFTSVGEPGLLAPGRWYEDPSRKLLRIRVRSTAGGDEIVNVTEVTEPRASTY